MTCVCLVAVLLFAMWYTVMQFTNVSFLSAAYFITFLTYTVMQVLDFMMLPLGTEEVRKQCAPDQSFMVWPLYTVFIITSLSQHKKYVNTTNAMFTVCKWRKTWKHYPLRCLNTRTVQLKDRESFVLLDSELILLKKSPATTHPLIKQSAIIYHNRIPE